MVCVHFWLHICLHAGAACVQDGSLIRSLSTGESQALGGLVLVEVGFGEEGAAMCKWPLNSSSLCTGGSWSYGKYSYYGMRACISGFISVFMQVSLVFKTGLLSGHCLQASHKLSRTCTGGSWSYGKCSYYGMRACISGFISVFMQVSLVH